MPSADVKLAYDSRDVVGESVIWSPGQSALYWVDIVGSRIHRFDPHSGDHLEWQTPDLPTSIGLCRSGGFIVGLRQRICLWEPGGEFETFAVPETGLPSNRLNEGVVAPDGSFWVGTMLDNIGPKGEPKEAKEATGSLYRVGSDGNVTRLTDLAFGITNTMVWLENGQFITADTTKNALYAFDYHAERPALLHQRTFAPSLDRGLPDGSCRNASGTVLFNCRVAGGSAVAKLSPIGELLGYIDLPCRSPTSCTFGGSDLGTLYITSARFGLDPEFLERHPHEGGLFAIDLADPGNQSYVFGV